jgi:hypothetical protein
MAVQQLAVNVLSNQKDREKLFKMRQEASNSLTRVEAERGLITDMVAEACQELKLPKRLVNKLVKVYHKQNYAEEVALHEDFERLYEAVAKREANVS